MGEVGVIAVVEGLASFVGDMGKIQSSIEAVAPPASLLQEAFGALGKAAGDFASWVGDVLTYTLGNLLAGAIRDVTAFIGDMITKTIEAGNEFQTLTLRLNGMNMDAAMKSGKDYNTAMAESVVLTQEQLTWVQKLAMATPFNNTVVADVYTMARTYGFADEQARSLTQTTGDFTAGMGLSGETMIQIIRNLGQMGARGKITQKEMKDLSNSYVPLDDILKRICDTMNAAGVGFVDNTEKIGKQSDKLDDLKGRLEIALQKQAEFTDTTKESVRMANTLSIEKLRREIDDTTAGIGELDAESKKLITVADLTEAISKPGGGIPAHFFTDAFEQMVKEEPRFIGASERMARTFKASTDNVQDLFTSFGGWKVITPILDVLGGKVADFMDQFLKSDEAGQNYTALGERLQAASIKIGETFSYIISQILGLGPSSADLATNLVTGIEKFSTWLTENKDGIVSETKEIWDTFKGWWDWLGTLGQPVLFSEGGIKDDIRALYDEFFKLNTVTGTTGWQDLTTAVGDLGKAIGDVVIPVLEGLGIYIDKNNPGLQGFTAALNAISKWISENEGTLQVLLQLFIGFLVVQTVENLVWQLGASLIGMAATVLATGAALVVIIVVVGTLLIVGGYLYLLFISLQNSWNIFVDLIELGATIIERYFQNMETTIKEIVTGVQDAWKNGDWGGVAWAIMSGIADGIMRNVYMIYNAIRDAVTGAQNEAMNTMQAHSPSKVFANIGGYMMQGMALGITENAGLAMAAMQAAMGAVTMPAMQAPTVMQQYTTAAPSAISNTYQSSQSYNLSIHSSASQENVIQDFNMMRSLSGA